MTPVTVTLPGKADQLLRELECSASDHLLVDTNLDTPTDLSFYHTLPQPALVLFIMRRDTHKEAKELKNKEGSKF